MTEKAPFMNRKSKIISAFVIAASLAGAGIWGVSYAKSTSLIGDKSVSVSSLNKRVVATIDGAKVSEIEIQPLLSQGVDKAVAVDRYINKVLAASLAQKLFPDEAKAVLQGAEREALAQLYVSKRSQDMSTAVTDDEIGQFYEKHVKSDDFSLYKVSYFLSQDPKEADDISSSIRDGRSKEVASKFKPVKDGDGFLEAKALPFGIGPVVHSMKTGEYSRPFVLRNGVIVLRLDEIKAQPAPSLEKAKASIVELIVSQKLADEMTKTRQGARIELN
jgi:peptidyl-prolyl cis-trans isomerase C